LNFIRNNCRTCELEVDAVVIIWNFRGADVNNEEIGIVEDNSSLSAIYKETSSGVEFSMLISRLTQDYLIWELLF
jgi:hypothetical protein